MLLCELFCKLLLHPAAVQGGRERAAVDFVAVAQCHVVFARFLHTFPDRVRLRLDRHDGAFPFVELVVIPLDDRRVEFPQLIGADVRLDLVNRVVTVDEV